MEFNTALLHKGFNGEKAFGSTLTPIYQVSAFSHSSAEQLEKVFNNRAPGYAYSRIGNPTVTSFENRIASIENGVGAVACSSGMAAVTMALLNVLESGDEVIASAGLFGGTIDLFGDLEPFGIVTRYVNKVTAEEIEPLINEKQKQSLPSLSAIPDLKLPILTLYQSLFIHTVFRSLSTAQRQLRILFSRFNTVPTSLFIPRQSTLTAAEIQSAE